ncbi:hypothetical protein L7F22_004819 [Adiantum nelumboides]|nr:hypothetical protein [Adiantum nelumboides]
MTSSVTRLIIHLTKLGGQAGPCPTIPEAIHEECKAKYLPLNTRREVARALEEVLPSDFDLSDLGDDASPAALVASGVAAASGGGSSSSSKKKASSQGGRPPKQAKQATLAQVVGKEHVVQVITDNVSNCASMGRKLEAEFPFIVWTPCASLCIDLHLEDIGELPWVKDILSQALSIVTFINVKVKVLAIFRSYSDLELKKPSATRFAAMWLLLERLYDVQNKLQKTVVSDELKEWLEGETTTSQQEAKAIQRLCLKEEFWQEVKGLVIAILPLYSVLRMIDMEGSTIGLLHHFMEEASKEIEACTVLDGPIDGSRDVLEDTPKRDDIVYLVKKRREWMKRPIHGFAALLRPAYKKPSLFFDQVLNEERMKYLPKVLKEELHGEFLQEVINYGDQRGTAFASAMCWKRESLVKPLFWWESFGYQMPHLQRIAIRVLGQVYVDECKLSVETLKSLNKDHDLEEEQIFRELYMELEEIDRRVSRTRSRKKVVVRRSATRGRGSSTSAVRGGSRASTRAPTTYVRRGSGSVSSTTTTTLENVPLSRSTEPREPEFDDEGNILSEGDYGFSSTHSDTSSDEDDTHEDSDWETDTST